MEYSGADGRSRIPLWDFSDYGSYTTETALVGQHGLHWFWDSTHYKRVLGSVIVKRILKTGDTDFGTLLSPEDLDQHFAVVREQQRMYRETHPADVRRVHNLYQSVVGFPTREETAENHRSN
jgi:hypothetical protein